MARGVTSEKRRADSGCDSAGNCRNRGGCGNLPLTHFSFLPESGILSKNGHGLVATVAGLNVDLFPIHIAYNGLHICCANTIELLYTAMQ